MDVTPYLRQQQPTSTSLDEPIAGPSHLNTQMMEVAPYLSVRSFQQQQPTSSSVPVRSFQQQQPTSSSVPVRSYQQQQPTSSSVPLCVQQMTFDDDEFTDDSDGVNTIPQMSTSLPDTTDYEITNCCKCQHLITDPKTLPCLDSLCSNCYTELCNVHSANTSGVAACPRCADEFRLPTTDRQTLPDHGFVETLVTLRKIGNQRLADDGCDICKQLATNSQRVADAERYCIECRLRMCAECAIRHPIVPSTKNHHLVELGLDSAKKVLLASKCNFPVCANHRDKCAAVHCYQCSISLCSECQSIHSNHDIEVLRDYSYGELTVRVKLLNDQLHERFATCKDKSARLQKLLSDRRSGVELAENVIRRKADEMTEQMQSQMQKECDDLLTVLHSHSRDTITSLEAETVKLLTYLSWNKQALKFTEELLEKGSLEDMLLNYRMLKDRVTRLCNMSDVSSMTDDNASRDVLSDSLIHDVCDSLDSQSKS